MTRFINWIPLILFISICAGGFFLLLYPGAIIVVTTLLCTYLLVFTGLFIFAFQKRRREALKHWLCMLICLFSGIAFFLFLEQRIAQIVFLVVISTIPSLYMRELMRIEKDGQLRSAAFQSLMFYIVILSFFYLSVVLFDARFFFAFPRGIMIAIAYIASLLLLLPILSTVFSSNNFWWHVFLLPFFYSQSIAIITALPQIPLVKGIVVTGTMYALYDILVQGRSEGITRRRIIRTLGISCGAIIISLLTARWL